MISRHQWISVRLRHCWHRLFVRWCGDNDKKISGKGNIVTNDGSPSLREQTRLTRRRRRGVLGVLKYVLLAIVASGVIIFFSIYFAWLQQERSSEIFLHTVVDMYEQEASGDGDSRQTGDDRAAKRKGPSYDPKARPYVDPNMHPNWGPEAEKKRAKRSLFLDVHRISKEKGRPLLNLQELMALPSTFDPSRELSDTTIILNHWKRTTLADQLDSILRQTVAPIGGVWVCLFHSPRELEYRAIVESYRERFKPFGGLFFTASTFNFKYYGRFQLALQARTRYVWIVDDDVLPGNKFLEELSHIAGIPEATGWTAGADGDGSVGPMALGSVGWVMPGPNPSDGWFYGYRDPSYNGGLYLPDKRYGIGVPHLQEVDLLCSQWFIERDWVPLLFREHWETSKTGEDYMLAFSLRKYAGVRSYVMPMDLSDSETWGNTDVEWQMQNKGSGGTTGGNMVPMRDRLWHRLFKRGGDYFLSTKYAQTPRPILVIVDSEKDAWKLRPLFVELETSSQSFPVEGEEGQGNSSPRITTGRSVRVVLTGRGGEAVGCTAAATALGEDRSQSYGGEGLAALCHPDLFRSAWQLNAGRHFPRDETTGPGGTAGGGRDHNLMTDLSMGVLGAVQTVRPLAMVTIARGTGGGGGAAVGEALSAVSTTSGVPLIRLPQLEDSSGAVRWLAWLSPNAFSRWHKARLDILVVYDPSSPVPGAPLGHTEQQLAALLESLDKVNFLGDSVRLTVAAGGAARVPQSVGDLEWPHGPKVVRESLHMGGSVNGAERTLAAEEEKRGALSSGALAALALTSWVPQDDDNFVVVLEADTVVSEFFYSWLKAAVLEIGYSGRPSWQFLQSGGEADGSNRSGRASGVCLQDGKGRPGAWLLSPALWRSVQAECLGGISGGGGGAEAMRCARDGLIPPPEGSVCPATDGVFLAPTTSKGKIRWEKDKLITNSDELVALAKDALFGGR